MAAPKSKNKQNKKVRTRTVINKIPPSITTLPSFKAYDLCVRDPCSANLAHAPYSGAESAYLIRLTKNIFITCPGTYTGGGVDAIGNFCVQIQCKTFPNYTQASSTTPTGTSVIISDNTNFLATGVVESYRCVAACAKWVPIGAIAKRSGIVGLNSQPNPPYGATTTVNYNDAVQAALRRDSNGSSHHEIRFLPSNGDESFIEYNSTTLFADATTLTVTGVGVDTVTTSTTNANVSGYIEFTGVYEWMPRNANGLSSAVMMPPPFTTQQHQSTIADVGAYLFDGVRNGASALGGAFVKGATRAVMQSISGMGVSRTSGPGLLTY